MKGYPVKIVTFPHIPNTVKLEKEGMNSDSDDFEDVVEFQYNGLEIEVRV